MAALSDTQGSPGPRTATFVKAWAGAAASSRIVPESILRLALGLISDRASVSVVEEWSNAAAPGNGTPWLRQHRQLWIEPANEAANPSDIV